MQSRAGLWGVVDNVKQGGEEFKERPNRIVPGILLTEPDEPVHVLSGPFRLVGSSAGDLEADLVFQWLPSAGVVFEGTYAQPVDISQREWTLESKDSEKLRVPVHVTQASLGASSSFVRGFAARPFNIGRGKIDALRFYLVNFPDYIGTAVRYECGGSYGLMTGRLQTDDERGCCQLDKVPEVKDLARSDAGFVISHVGLWIPSSGAMSEEEAESVLTMLHFWFGLLRGAWTGPVFPEGLGAGRAVVWRQYAPWKLSGFRQVSSWLPDRTPADLSSAFQGYLRRWHDSAWRDPIITSISWYIAANAHKTASETRLILAQVALELLSWVLLVETQQRHSRADFENLSAAGRIRALLHHIGVPTDVPEHMNGLKSLRDADAFDGPGIITKVRNGLVHSTEKKRRMLQSIDGEQRMECSQLALQFLEFALLAVCGYDGHYAQRAWRGWKGDDEVPVPWMKS